MKNSDIILDSINGKVISTTGKRSFYELAYSFVNVEADRSLILHEALALFGDAPTYDAYMVARASIIAGYLSKKPAANEAAQNTFFSRFTCMVKQYADEIGSDVVFPEKPAAEGSAAKAKAVQREKAKVEKTDAVKAAELALSTTKALEKEATQAKLKTTNEQRDGFISFFKTLSDAERDTFYALREKRFGAVLSVMPVGEIEAGLKTQKDIVAALAKVAKASKVAA